jgi:glycosyltransferase involved in cell wall biosynthesis
MKILLIHQYFLENNDSGGSRWTSFIKKWNDKNHEIVVLAGMVHYTTGKKHEKYRGKFFFTDIISEKLTIIRNHVSESYNSSFIGRLWAYFSFVFSSLISGIFKIKNDFDLIIVTSPPLFVGITALILSKFKSIPFVFEIRDLWPESAIDTGVLKSKLLIKVSLFFEKILYNNASLIVVLTPAFKHKLVEIKNVNPDKIVLIPNAADFSLTDQLMRTFDIVKFKNENNLNNKFIVLYVGAHGLANNLIQIIEAAEKTQFSDPEIFYLLIGDGMEKKRLVNDAKNKNLKNIIFLDPVSKNEIFKYILSSDIGTSVLKKVDTFKTVYSNKTFDYMSCKKPILMLIDGISRKLVEDADCGIYVEPEDIDSFVEKIRYYKYNLETIKVHGENGYNYAKLHFDRDKLANDYIEILNKHIGKINYNE